MCTAYQDRRVFHSRLETTQEKKKYCEIFIGTYGLRSPRMMVVYSPLVENIVLEDYKTTSGE